MGLLACCSFHIVNMNPSNSGSGSGPRRTRLPVNRRAGYQANPPHVPLPSIRDQPHRVTSLRNQLRYPHAQQQDTLQYHLTQSHVHWDINRAAEHFWEVDSAVTQPAARPTSRLRTAPTIEQERLHQVHDTQRRLELDYEVARQRAEEQGHGVDVPDHRTSNAILMILFNRVRFLQVDADNEIARRDGDYDDIINELAALRVAPGGQMARDERTALLLAITSTNSWYTGQQFLAQHDWDIATAIDVWIAIGRLPLAFPPLHRLRNGNLANDQNDGLRGVNVNRPRRILFG